MLPPDQIQPLASTILRQLNSTLVTPPTPRGRYQYPKQAVYSKALPPVCRIPKKLSVINVERKDRVRVAPAESSRARISTHLLAPRLSSLTGISVIDPEDYTGCRIGPGDDCSAHCVERIALLPTARPPRADRDQLALDGFSILMTPIKADADGNPRPEATLLPRT